MYTGFCALSYNNIYYKFLNVIFKPLNNIPRFLQHGVYKEKRKTQYIWIIFFSLVTLLYLSIKIKLFCYLFSQINIKKKELENSCWRRDEVIFLYSLVINECYGLLSFYYYLSLESNKISFDILKARLIFLQLWTQCIVVTFS